MNMLFGFLKKIKLINIVFKKDTVLMDVFNKDFKKENIKDIIMIIEDFVKILLYMFLRLC